MDSAQTTFRTRAGGDRCLVVVAPSGELDETTAEVLRAEVCAFIARGHPELVLDLSDITFCDVCGLSALIGIRRCALEAGGSMRLAAVPADLTRLLERTGLDGILTAHTTLDEALAAHHGMAAHTAA